MLLKPVYFVLVLTKYYPLWTNNGQVWIKKASSLKISVTLLSIYKEKNVTSPEIYIKVPQIPKNHSICMLFSVCSHAVSDKKIKRITFSKTDFTEFIYCQAFGTTVLVNYLERLDFTLISNIWVGRNINQLIHISLLPQDNLSFLKHPQKLLPSKFSGVWIVCPVAIQMVIQQPLVFQRIRISGEE